MKCAYKSVLDSQSVERFCTHYGVEFLKYADASLAVNLHDIFGFGSNKRLPELFDDMNPRLNAQMSAMVEKEGEDLWDTTKETHWWTARKIAHATGWDPQGAADDMPVPDNWRPQMHTPKEARQHAARKNYVEAMEVKLGLYWHMVLDYMIVKYGFGAERLDRLYRSLRRDYIAFAAEFLRGTKSAEKNMIRMIKDMQDKVKAIGIEFDYGDGGKMKIRTIGGANNAENDTD